jgi:outer membrane protein
MRKSVCFIFFAAAISLRAGDPTVTSSQTITLERAYDLALASDQSIRIAYWEVRKANLLPWSALTRLGPQLTGSSNLQRSGSTRNANGLGSTQLNTSHAGLSFEQPLVDLTVFPAYRLGKLSAGTARLEHRFTVRGVLFGVAQAYYEVLKQQRVVEVNQQTLELAGRQLDIAQKRMDVGEVTRSDVLRARVAVESARRLLVESQNTLLLDRNTLSNILNLGGASDFHLIEPPAYPNEIPAFDELLSIAMTQREDLRVASIGIDQDIARRNEVVGSYGPRLIAQWNGNTSTTSQTSARENDWNASLAVQVPFFTGGQREIDLLTANRQIEQTRLNYEKTAKQLQQEVKQAWLAVHTLVETIAALRAQVAAAEQSYADLENQYRAGTATSVDVLAALNDLNNARRDLAVQVYDYQVALRNIDQVSGKFQEARVQRVQTR